MKGSATLTAIQTEHWYTYSLVILSGTPELH